MDLKKEAGEAKVDEQPGTSGTQVVEQGSGDQGTPVTTTQAAAPPLPSLPAPDTPPLPNLVRQRKFAPPLPSMSSDEEDDDTQITSAKRVKLERPYVLEK